MIKQKELRIGNYIETKGVDIYSWTVYSIGQMEGVHTLINGFRKDIIKPIPLTEEWLLRFGFEYRSNVNDGVIVKEYYLRDSMVKCVESLSKHQFSTVSGKSFAFYKGGSFITGHLDYVHQLQNIHFAIFAEELELKK